MRFYFILCVSVKNVTLFVLNNLMLICVKKIKIKIFIIGRTDGRTDGRSTQNYSPEPHKKIFLIYVNFMLIFVKIIKKNLKFFF